MKHLVKTMILAGVMLFPALGAAKPEKTLEQKVRHELVTLPFFGVFDNMTFRLDGDTVTLFGSVTRPTLKSSAENVVKRLEGVAKVDNQIEVLPLSPNDDRIRLATLRATSSSPCCCR